MVTTLVLMSALLHASWNALGKAIPDPLVSAGLIGVAYTGIGGIACLLLPLPDAAAWPFLVVSVVLQSCYLVILMAGYQKGDFGNVYPVARGIAPVVVALVSTTVLNERLQFLQLLGIVVVCGSLVVLVTARRPSSRAGLVLAVVTGLTIAAYSLVDGVGVRHSGHPLSYAMWLFLVQGPVIPLAGLATRGLRYVGELRPHLSLGLLGGVLSLVAYAIVVWAQSRAPLAQVSALRETSIVFAAVIAAVFFRERFGAIRFVAAAGTVAGIVLMQLV